MFDTTSTWQPCFSLARTAAARAGAGSFTLVIRGPALGACGLEIELERLDHGAHEIHGRLGQVAGGDEDRVEAGLLEGRADVVDVLDPYHGFVVGESHPGQLSPPGERDGAFGREFGETGGLVARVGVGYLPVLASGAEDIASVAAQGESAGTGMEVEERLLLDLVADDARRPPVGEADHAAVRALLEPCKGPRSSPG